MCRHLAQRFVASNPSPRYIQACADAFRTGAHDGNAYSGAYGDLGAAVAAVLLDREARSTTLDLDPNHGRLREPLLKVIHFLRSMQYSSLHDREVELVLNSWSKGEDRIGQQIFLSPTVFNFFLPDYQPSGPVASNGLVAPEAQLGTAPYLIGFLNGLTSLSTYGLTTCADGFGSTDIGGRRCGNLERARESSDGSLAFTPSVGASTSAIVDELDLLLTAGRLHSHARVVITSAYDAKLTATSDATEALRLAQALFATAAEFHSTNYNTPSNTARTAPPVTPSLGRPYKAVIVLYLNGGVDSFNVLVPHSGCGTSNIASEYQTARAHVALDGNSVLQITVPAGTQPCATFGLHPSLGTVKSMYDAGDAAMIANVGTLVEPITRTDVKCKVAPCKRVPPSLFAHNTQSTRAFTVHAQYANAQGVVGRMADALKSSESPFSTKAYSLNGLAKILEGGGSTPQETVGKGGIEMLQAFSELGAPIAQLAERESTSI